MTTYFNNKEHCLAFKKAWALASQDNCQTATHHFLYNLLRGFPGDRGFTPVTNKNKLANGMAPNQGAFSTMYNLRWLQIKATKVVLGEYRGMGSIAAESCRKFDLGFLHTFINPIIKYLPDDFYYDGKKKIDNNFNWYCHMLTTLTIPEINRYDQHLKEAA